MVLLEMVNLMPMILYEVVRMALPLLRKLVQFLKVPVPISATSASKNRRPSWKSTCPALNAAPAGMCSRTSRSRMVRWLGSLNCAQRVSSSLTTVIFAPFLTVVKNTDAEVSLKLPSRKTLCSQCGSPAL